MQTHFRQEIEAALLRRWASCYTWWQTPREAVEYPDRVIAQGTKIGGFDDVVELVAAAGEERLRRMVQQAEAGQSDEPPGHIGIIGRAAVSSADTLPRVELVARPWPCLSQCLKYGRPCRGISHDATS